MRFLLLLPLIFFSCAKDETAINFDETITYATDVKVDAAGDTVYAVYLPSGFTPNGNGVNDVYWVRGTGIDPGNYSMSIYNRLDNLIYYASDPDKGWDGRIQGQSVLMPSGIYTVDVLLADTLGEEHHYRYHATLVK
jgi:gliding motility-associated-like protein